MEGVDKINEIPYGGGYTQAKREFDEALRTIPQMGYGLVLISHAQDKTFTDENGVEYNQIVPTLGNGPRLVIDRMADIIGYAHPMQEVDGSTHTTLYMRGTPRFLAGSRFAYTPDSIEFNYQNLVDAIGDAIDKQAAEFDNKFVTNDRTQEHEVIEGPSFDELMAEFNKIVGQIQDAVGGSFGSTWAPRITEIVDRNLGKGHKVNEMTRDQKEHLELIVEDLKEAVANGL